MSSKRGTDSLSRHHHIVVILSITKHLFVIFNRNDNTSMGSPDIRSRRVRPPADLSEAGRVAVRVRSGRPLAEGCRRVLLTVPGRCSLTEVRRVLRGHLRTRAVQGPVRDDPTGPRRVTVSLLSGPTGRGQGGEFQQTPAHSVPSQREQTILDFYDLAIGFFCNNYCR